MAVENEHHWRRSSRIDAGRAVSRPSLTLPGRVAISRRMTAIGTQDRLRRRTSAPAPVRDR
jgi:hypothetical protein